MKKEVPDCELVKPQDLEDGEFDIEPGWYLVGSKMVTAVSTVG